MEKGNYSSILKLGRNSLANFAGKARINFNEYIDSSDKIIAIDEEAPFLVLVKKSNDKICWIVDFLLGERIKNYSSIPKIKVSDSIRVLRIL